jgi:hypothetical protein
VGTSSVGAMPAGKMVLHQVQLADARTMRFPNAPVYRVATVSDSKSNTVRHTTLDNRP